MQIPPRQECRASLPFQRYTPSHSECSKRLALQCTFCINATCKRHNWKLMQEAIEEVFELCENEQSRDDKRAKTETAAETQSISIKQEVERLLEEFRKKLQARQEELVANADLRAKSLIGKSETPEKLYVIVKSKINDFRKSSMLRFTQATGRCRP